jgi:hypothetical protein
LRTALERIAPLHWGPNRRVQPRSLQLFEIELAAGCEANNGELPDERLIARVRFVDASELRKIGEKCGGVHSRHGLEWPAGLPRGVSPDRARYRSMMPGVW